MRIGALVVKNPDICVTNTQKNTREHENLRRCDLRICVSAYSWLYEKGIYRTNFNS